MMQVENVTVNFGSLRAVNDVTMELNGGICGLLGPNGAGKTTLLRIMCGLIKPSAGRIKRSGALGYLPQRFAAYPELTVCEMLEYYAIQKKIPLSERKAGIEKAIEAVNLGEKAKVRCGKLSGGMLRRVGIAQAILGKPELILFDEPTAGLDPEERIRFRQLLGELKREGCSVLLSTHIVEDVEHSCDEIAVMNRGRLLSKGTPEQLAAYAEGKVFLVPAEEAVMLQKPYFLLGSQKEEGKEYLRILTSKSQGTAVSPMVEDGFMCWIHDEV